METVFDHNITDKEWQDICGLDKDLYLKVVDHESACLGLAYLYNKRGNRKMVEKYLKGLPPLVVNDFWRTVTHP